MSLYSKYRPQNFANLVGQEHIRITLLNEIQRELVTHAYLFTGPRGTGKTSSARLIAKSLNCEKLSKLGEPCDACDMCLRIRDGSLIDVLEIDAASNRGIDEIRELKEKINYAPTHAKNKVYIIDEVHMLTKEAFNALLKTLEEPPTSVYFILCTTEAHKIPETIISRCQRFDFKRIDPKVIMTRLSFIAQSEKIEVEDLAIELIARHVEGGLRDAIGLFEQLSTSGKLEAAHVKSHLGITGHDTIESLIALLKTGALNESLTMINQVYNEGYDLNAFVRELMECLRQNLLNSIEKATGETYTYLTMIERIDEARDMLKTTIIPQLPLEIAAIKICTPGITSPHPQTAPTQQAAQTMAQGAPPAPAPAPKATPSAAPAKAVKASATVAAAPAPKASAPSAEAELKSTAASTKAESETVEKLTTEFTKIDGAIKDHWQRILDHVDPPSLRRSLGQGAIQEETESALILVFRARFHMEKVNTTESLVKIESAIKHLFDKSLSISCELSLAPASPSHEADSSTAPTKNPAPSIETTPDDLAAKAMEMFGDLNF